MKYRYTFLLLLIVASGFGQKKPITISSLQELAMYASQSDHQVTLKPGLYKLADFLNADSIKAKLERKSFQYILFSGSNNVFILTGVRIELDTKLRQLLKHPIHTSEIVISGNNNELQGFEVYCVGNGTSPGGSVLSVTGNGNTFRNITLRVQGSFPYGYGDLFGKGGPDIIKHQKHSGFHIAGSNTNVYGCKLYMKSFGHGYYIQTKVENIHLEDCYVEGETRTTDEMLKETSGPAFDVQFRSWMANRKGEYIVTPGYSKSLCEDGFRTYGEIKNVSFKNCTAKNTRGGFELRTNSGIRLENCTVSGTERGFWVGNNAILKNCKGDASNGPLLFAEGSNLDVEIFLMPAGSKGLVHSLATIQGVNNKITIKGYKNIKRSQSIPILIGFKPPANGEGMSPYGEGIATGLVLNNETSLPVIVGEKATDCIINSKGKIEESKGTNIIIAN